MLHFLCDILVSDGDNFIYTNTNYFPPHRVEDLCNDLYCRLNGLQTENNESKLIDTDRNYNIKNCQRIWQKQNPHSWSENTVNDVHSICTGPRPLWICRLYNNLYKDS